MGIAGHKVHWESYLKLVLEVYWGGTWTKLELRALLELPRLQSDKSQLLLRAREEDALTGETNLLRQFITKVEVSLTKSSIKAALVWIKLTVKEQI